MSIAEAYDVPVARRPLVPPSPPRAPESMGTIGRILAMRENVLSTWGPRSYQEDIIQARFLLRSNFIVNQPDAIRHVLVDNYENYTRTAPGIRVLRPILGQGVLTAEGRAWKHQRRTLAPAFTPRSVATLVPHMVAGIDEAIARLRANGDRPVDIREAMQRMTLEIAGRTMFSFEMGRHGTTLREFIMEYGERLARPHPLDLLLPLSWPSRAYLAAMPASCAATCVPFSKTSAARTERRCETRPCTAHVCFATATRLLSAASKLITVPRSPARPL